MSEIPVRTTLGVGAEEEETEDCLFEDDEAATPSNLSDIYEGAKERGEFTITIGEV